MNPVVIAIGLGILGTSVIHLSKGLMAYGLSSKPRKAKRLVYGLGILLNFTNPLWVVLANRFAPTPYYTSVYGFGLIPLLVFSYLVLHQGFSKTHLLSTAIIVCGTILLGYSQVISEVPSMYTPDPTGIVIFASLWLLVMPLILVGMKSLRLPIQEVAFGLAAGGMAALDAVIKGVAQTSQIGSTYLPVTTLGWFLFLGSFLGALGAFVLIQWSYLRHCRPSIMGGVYDVSYTAMPLLLLAGFQNYPILSPLLMVGFTLLLLGVILSLDLRAKPSLDSGLRKVP
jgi:heme/copper-type cytochrome/quinol oxidase subunit 4